MSKKLHSLSDPAWFHWHQPLLLKMANTRYGRELLCITDDLPKLNRIRPDMVQAPVGETQWVSEFRTSNKYGNVIRHRWSEFQKYANYLREESWTKEYAAAKREHKRLERLYGRRIPVIAGGTETPLFTEPDPESDNRVDGWVGRTSVDLTIAGISDAVGNTGSDVNATKDAPYLRASTTTDQYQRINRPIFVFKTSAITDTDTLDSAILSLHLSSSATGLNDGSSVESKTHICGLAALVAADDQSIANADYQGIAHGTSFGAGVTQDSVGGAYDPITLNAAGESHISFTDRSRFAGLYGWDVNQNETGITWVSENIQRVVVILAETTGTVSDPKLVVTHSAVGGGFAHSQAVMIG